MFRTALVSSVLVFGLASSHTAGLSAQTPPAANPTAPVPATPESAATFLGDWTLTAQGANGPATFALSIKVEAGKVVAEISSDTQGRQPITEISKSGTTLQLQYGFDYQGMAIPVFVTLTPAGDKVTLQIDFANGAYQMTGTATKKVK